MFSPSLAEVGMGRANKEPLDARVARAATKALVDENYVSVLGVFLRIGWIDGGTVQSWRQGRFDCFEERLQVNRERIKEAMRLIETWARQNGLIPTETSYVARTPARPELRFSVSGDAAIEQRYRTHWVSGALSEKKRERLAEKTSRAPELVAIIPRNQDWQCHRCGKTGGILMMEKEGPACLDCVGLGDLEFLYAGNAKLTRLAKAKSTRHAVVVKWSRTRKRYERQGLLLEPQALSEAEQELGIKREEFEQVE
jgi:hypothetical protein